MTSEGPKGEGLCPSMPKDAGQLLPSQLSHPRSSGQGPKEGSVLNREGGGPSGWLRWGRASGPGHTVIAMLGEYWRDRQMGDTIELGVGGVGRMPPPRHISGSCFQHEMTSGVGSANPVLLYQGAHRPPRVPRPPRDPRPRRGRRSMHTLTLSLGKGFKKLLPISLPSSRGGPGGLVVPAILLLGEFWREKRERKSSWQLKHLNCDSQNYPLKLLEATRLDAETQHLCFLFDKGKRMCRVQQHFLRADFSSYCCLPPLLWKGTFIDLKSPFWAHFRETLTSPTFRHFFENVN